MAEISIESLSRNFENHLCSEGNFRIIFSGKFGIGKTHFLNNFFDSNKEKYNKILISPVNYVINSNENIFELIKADILKELFLTEKIEFKKLSDDTTLQKISAYFEKNPLALPRFMAKALSKINPVIETPLNLIDSISKIIEDYKKGSKNKNEDDKTRSEQIATYLDESEQKLGSIYEYNYITKVINTFLDEIRGTKKNVLIIDDLDRIDPEHIFRILNILSAHNNHSNDQNKFSFDHIIIVCDINNIRKIFYHRYGADVDFDGYIDKFYSTDIFHYTNSDAIQFYIRESFNSEKEKFGTGLLTLTLQKLVSFNHINVRKLLKHKYDISFNNFLIHEVNKSTPNPRPTFLGNFHRIYVDSDDLPILRYFKLMSVICGDFNLFLNHLTSLTKEEEAIAYSECKSLVEFLALQYHISSRHDDSLYFSHYNKNSSMERYDFPEIKYFGKTFRIILKWTNATPYDPNESYFKNAKSFDHEAHKEIYNNNFIPETFKLSTIFEAIKDIAFVCRRNKYIAKAGIADPI